MDVTHRSCVFTVPRYRAGAGYNAFPAMLAIMLFFLPKFSIRSSRFVRAQFRLFELWSPNSSQRAFYPGLRNVDHRAGLLDEEDFLRCDGHRGRFDPTSCPQLYDPTAPWLGFIKNSGNCSLVEFSLTPLEWDPSGPNPMRGYMNQDYLSRLQERQTGITDVMNSLARIEHIYPDLWLNRPTPNDDILDELNTTYLTYGQAVDYAAIAHRSIKHQDAWNRMAALLLRDYDHPVAREEIQVTLADESLMGVWINGVTDSQGLRLLHHRVPCFVINEVSSSEDVSRANKGIILDSFVEKSGVEWMVSDEYMYHRSVKIANFALQDAEHDVGIEPTIPAYLPADYLRASPTVQLARANAQSVAAPETDHPRIDQEEELLPPKVAAPGTGSWTHWRESTLEDNRTPCFEQLGARRARDVGEFCFYDRVYCRFLHFDDEPSIPANYKADPTVWGQPIGIRHFVHIGGKTIFEPRNMSTWMYSSERPARGDEGRVYDKLARPRNSSRGRVAEEYRRRSPPPRPSQYSRRARGDYYRPAEVIFRSPPRRDRDYHDLPPRRDPSYCPRRGRNSERSPRASTSYRRLAQEERPSDRPTLESMMCRRPSSRSRSPCQDRCQSLSSYCTSRAASPLPEAPSPPRSPSPSRAPSPIVVDVPVVEQEIEETVPLPAESSSPIVVDAPVVEQEIEETVPLPAESSDAPVVEQEIEETVPLPAESSDAPVVEQEIEETAPLPVESRPELSLPTSAVFAFPTHDPETAASLVKMFPAATKAPVPVVKSAPARAMSRYLLLWNFPAFYLWQNVISWVCSILPHIDDPVIDRIVRTNDSGFQIFWLRFIMVEGAQRFRGIVQGLTLGMEETLVHCDFVQQDEFNGANGRSADHWTEKGLSDNRSTFDKFSDKYCQPRNAVPSLLSRLTMNMETIPEIPIIKRTSRPNRRQRKKKLVPAEGGAL